MADVFISYKSERRAGAEHLAEILADYGYSVWWDYGLISGRDFGAQIEKELRDAKVVVVLWCSLAVGSEWVREEAALAKRLDKIVPTLIEPVELPLGFSLSQTLDLSDWDGAPQSNKLERLLRDIGHRVGRAPRPNLEGLDRTERAWRRFGAPSLRAFALIEGLERTLPPRTMPAALALSAPAQSGVKPENAKGARQHTTRTLLIAGCALMLIALGWGLTQLFPSDVEGAGTTAAPAETNPKDPTVLPANDDVKPETERAAADARHSADAQPAPASAPAPVTQPAESDAQRRLREYCEQWPEAPACPPQ